MRKRFHFGIAESPICTICQADIESIAHLPYSWVLVSLPVLAQRDNNICSESLQEDLTFGKLEFRGDFVLFNHSLLLVKFNADLSFEMSERYAFPSGVHCQDKAYDSIQPGKGTNLTRILKTGKS